MYTFTYIIKLKFALLKLYYVRNIPVAGFKFNRFHTVIQ